MLKINLDALVCMQEELRSMEQGGERPGSEGRASELRVGEGLLPQDLVEGLVRPHDMDLGLGSTGSILA